MAQKSTLLFNPETLLAMESRHFVIMFVHVKKKKQWNQIITYALSNKDIKKNHIITKKKKNAPGGM